MRQLVRKCRIDFLSYRQSIKNLNFPTLIKPSELKEKIERLEERFINEENKADLSEKCSAKFRKERQELEVFVKLTTFSNPNLVKYLSSLPVRWAF